MPPSFATQPAGWSVPVGTAVDLERTVLRHRAFELPVAASTARTLPVHDQHHVELCRAEPSNYGNYQLVATNFGGAVTSAVAPVTVGQVAFWGTYSQVASSSRSGLRRGSATWLPSRRVRASAWRCAATGRSMAGAAAPSRTFPPACPASWASPPDTATPWPSVPTAPCSPGASIRPARPMFPLASATSSPLPAGFYHSAALRADGTVVVWGGTARTGETNIPPGLIKVAAIDANGNQTLALRQNGTVVGWGGATTAPVPPYLQGVAAAASGSATRRLLNLALLTNGALTAWNSAGPATNLPPGLTNLVAVENTVGSGGEEPNAHGVCLALRSNGTVVAWGSAVSALSPTCRPLSPTSSPSPPAPHMPLPWRTTAARSSSARPSAAPSARAPTWCSEPTPWALRP